VEIKDRWDLGIKTLAAVGAVVSIAVAVGNYVYTKQKDSLTALRESQKPFLQKQLELYLEAAKLTSQLATIDRNHDDWRKAELRFWQIYWGELVLVEDAGVKTAMARFGDQLNAVTFASDPQGALKEPAAKVAEACRKSIEESWGYAKLQPDAAAVR
jgi:hypothetical protein